jgi:hypothetical protein
MVYKSMTLQKMSFWRSRFRIGYRSKNLNNGEQEIALLFGISFDFDLVHGFSKGQLSVLKLLSIS